LIHVSIKNMRTYELFIRALSNETRLSVLKLLRAGPKSVKSISEELEFEQSRISHNLKCLLNCGFVRVEKRGKMRVYKLNEETIVPLFDIIDRHVRMFGEKLEKCSTLDDVKSIET